MQEISKLRNALGLSQQSLADRADVSLATIQNIEGNRANPSLETLDAILKILGSQLVVIARQTNIEMLNRLGLPIMVKEEIKAKPNLDLLVNELIIAYKNYDTSDPRIKTVLESTYLALRDHFPFLFKKYFTKMPIMKILSAKKVTGRHIKFRRIIIRNFSRYLT